MLIIELAKHLFCKYQIIQKYKTNALLTNIYEKQNFYAKLEHF